MRTNKIIIAVLLVLIVGYLFGINNVKNIIVVEKQVNAGDKYEFYNEIKDSKEVQNAKAILRSIKWGNSKVSMTRHSDFNFHFEDTNGKTSGEGYGLWISPNKDKISLVAYSEGNYVQLDKEKSEKLFKIITGKSLSEVK